MVVREIGRFKFASLERYKECQLNILHHFTWLNALIKHLWQIVFFIIRVYFAGKRYFETEALFIDTYTLPPRLVVALFSSC